MRSKTLIKECNCIHCLEKQEQINRSREYWAKVITSQVKDLESKLNEQIEKNVVLSKDANELTRASLVVSVSEDLADTEKEKFASMAENVEFDSAEKFAEKLETIKESYFPKTKIEEATSADEVDSVAANIPADAGTSDAMAAYTAAITKNLSSLKN